MMRYTVIYARQVSKNYSYWIYATEIIEARGIVHAQKLAISHLRELKKHNKNMPMRIEKIKQVTESDN